MKVLSAEYFCAKYRMLTLQRTISRHPFYFIALLFFVIAASVTIATDNKVDCFIRMNPLHERWLDIFFIGLTYLGDGIFSLLMAALVLLIWRDYRLTIHIVAAYLISGLVAQVLKRIWMAPRPRSIIDTTVYKNFLAGVTGTGFSSFPSGHTTSVFALATILVLHAGNKRREGVLLFIAVLVGYSRIYLGQHFLPDVTAGALLGTCTGVMVYTFVNLRRRTAGKASVQEALAEEPMYASNFAGN
jgi:membrane-associated phospholipid phosphatase